MGYRTVVMLSNDESYSWSNDPDLGRKILRGMNYVGSASDGHYTDLGYGRVVECAHADTETLALVDGYTTFSPISYSSTRQRSREEVVILLLKRAAENLGYRLVKKPAKK